MGDRGRRTGEGGQGTEGRGTKPTTTRRFFPSDSPSLLACADKSERRWSWYRGALGVRLIALHIGAVVFSTRQKAEGAELIVARW